MRRTARASPSQVRLQTDAHPHKPMQTSRTTPVHVCPHLHWLLINVAFSRAAATARNNKARFERSTLQFF